MAKEKTPRKVEIWIVTAPFVFGGESYEPGDELALPSGCEFDADSTALNQGRPTFKRVEVRGTSDNRWERITYEILPVERATEGGNA